MDMCADFMNHTGGKDDKTKKIKGQLLKHIYSTFSFHLLNYCKVNVLSAPICNVYDLGVEQAGYILKKIRY